MSGDPRDMSQMELEELLDQMNEPGGEAERDTKAWQKAHAEWERRENES